MLVVRNVAASPAYLGSSEFTASQNGVLIYGTAKRSSFDTLKWYSRDGSTVGSVEPIVDYQQFTLSPDGKHLALNSFQQHATGSLWLIDIATNTTTPLVIDPHAQSDPVWSPDSRYVAFNLFRTAEVIRRSWLRRLKRDQQQQSRFMVTMKGTGWKTGLRMVVSADARHQDSFDTTSDRAIGNLRLYTHRVFVRMNFICLRMDA